MCGNFFNPSSSSFLGGSGPVGQVGRAAASVAFPEASPFIYGAEAGSQALQGNFGNAALNAVGAFGAGGGFSDQGFSFGGGAGGPFGDVNSWLMNSITSGNGATPVADIGQATVPGGGEMAGGDMSFWQRIKEFIPDARTMSLISSGLNIGSGLYGLHNAIPGMQASRTASQELQALISGQKSAMTDADSQAVNRAMAAGGYLGSGNQMTALRDTSSALTNARIQALTGVSGGGQAAGDLASRSLGSIGYAFAGDPSIRILQAILNGRGGQGA